MAKPVKEKRSLDETLKELNKKYSENPVQMASEMEKVDKVISTGSIDLDIKLGCGGIPVSPGGRNGKIVEIVGWESTGKSTLTQTIIGNAQKAGLKVLLVDSENSLDDLYTVKLGADPKDILTIKFDEQGGEVCYEKMQELVETGEINLVVIDSYNAIQPLKILQDGLDSSNMGLHARMMSKLLAKVNSYCTAYGTTFIFVGQYREKIGIMFGPTETTQGGNALKFYSHIRMATSRSTIEKNSTYEGGSTKGEKLGNLHKVNVFKNKVGSPFRKAEYQIIYGEGIDKVEEVMRLGHDYEVLNKRGKTVTYDEVKYSTEEFIQMIKDTPEFYLELKKKILSESKIKRIDKIEDPIDMQAITEGIVNEIEADEID